VRIRNCIQEQQVSVNCYCILVCESAIRVCLVRSCRHLVVRHTVARTQSSHVRYRRPTLWRRTVDDHRPLWHRHRPQIPPAAAVRLRGCSRRDSVGHRRFLALTTSARRLPRRWPLLVSLRAILWWCLRPTTRDDRAIRGNLLRVGVSLPVSSTSLSFTFSPYTHRFPHCHHHHFYHQSFFLFLFFILDLKHLFFKSFPLFPHRHSPGWSHRLPARPFSLAHRFCFSFSSRLSAVD